MEEFPLDWDVPDTSRAAGADRAGEPEEPQLGVPPQHLHGLFRLDIGSATSPGRQRARNEDSFLVQQLSWSNLESRHEAALLVVADGMGGHADGDRASLLTIQTVGPALAPVLQQFFEGQEDGSAAKSRKDALVAALQLANTLVYQQGKQAGSKGMGATAAVVLVRDGLMEIGHVGDCRVYHFHGGTLRQLTRDQTLVARLVELGQLSEAEAEDHPKSNEVTQAIGKYPQLDPAYYQQKLAHGDWLIVACDGLHAHVKKHTLEEVLRAAPLSAALVAHHLVDLTNFHGGSDNCTVVALRCY
jgi:protein phosphatase